MTAATKPFLPSPLQKGDYIGIAAPSGPVTSISYGIRMLQDAGLQTIVSSDIARRDNYLAGTDHRRIQELHDLFRNPKVKAIWAIRGGFGCARIINGLDYDLIKQNPKIIIGFSDLTVLLNTIQQQTGLITFHGPVLSTIMRDGSEVLNDCLNTLSRPISANIKIKGLEILRPAEAEGRLVGGNLTCLLSLLGTPYEPDWQNAILLLEDINEPAYKVDRMLTQLQQAGCLDRLNGIILGDFLDNELRTLSDIELIWQRILDISTNIPVWANFPMGHGSRNMILPLGLPVLMDSNSGNLIFLNL